MKKNALFAPGIVVFLVGMVCAALGAYKVLMNGILDPRVASAQFTVAAFCIVAGVCIIALGRLHAISEQIRREDEFRQSRSPACPWMGRIDLPEPDPIDAIEITVDLSELYRAEAP